MAGARTLLITGGNAGLGFETLKFLCQSSQAYRILLGGRSLEKAENAAKSLQKEYPDSKSTVSAVQIDVVDDKSIEAAYKKISSEHDHLDVLINNAGASFDQERIAGNLTMREVWNKTWDVNVAGASITTHIFLPLLLKSKDPRVLFIASGTSSLTETENLDLGISTAPPAGWPKGPAASRIFTYRSSKAGMNMMMREWARTLRNDGVKVFAVSPGFLATGLGGDREANRKLGAIDPEIGANFVKDVVEGKRDGDVGKVIRRDMIQPW